MADWTILAREALQQGPAALVTILATEGSAPRGPGARMVVTEAGLKGTIGGGKLEHLATAQAREILALGPGSWRVQDYPLGPLLGQCCGGRVRLMVERLDGLPEGEGPFEVILSERVERRAFPGEIDGSSCPPDMTAECGALRTHQWGPVLPRVPLGPGFRRGTIEARGPLPVSGASFVEPAETDLLPVYMFGAGHVGRAVAARAVGLPLHFAWHDSRPEAAETPGVVLADEAGMVACAGQAGEDAAVVIFTHDHGLDYRLTAAALGSRARFVGLIGSQTKRARFLSRLEKDGIDAARLSCPIGLPGISGKEPEVIAIATLAQLLALRSGA
jgi:xanthine dehydrogenase accessory factor